MIAEVLMIKLTEGEKAEKQKAKGMTLEKILFWKVECETKKKDLGREGVKGPSTWNNCKSPYYR